MMVLPVNSQQIFIEVQNNIRFAKHSKKLKSKWVVRKKKKKQKSKLENTWFILIAVSKAVFAKDFGDQLKAL